MKKGLITFVLTSTLIGLTGCAGDNQNAGNDNNGANLGVNNVRNDMRNNDNNGVTGRNVSNQNLRVSTRAANNVERLGEVEQAHVIIRNNDAYVAVRLNNQQGTTGDRAGTGTGTTNNRGGNGNNAGNTQNTGTGNTGITGTNTNTGNNGTTGNNTNVGNGFTGNYTNSGNTGTTGPNMNTGNGAITGNNTGAGTDRITGTNTNTGNNGTGGTGTNTGNTGTNMNGNNGTGGTNYKEVSTRLEQRIADQVRAADKKIHNVYVSYDNDFYSQMNNYTNDIQNGRNRNGIWDDFTDTVGRFFR
ncbi:YhcN/YlaJ family sporulation lipoprotein [Neobacillus sp. 179-C4.2 HS]|uniref:YhcN/YlaJ family sporulation lipoprotein n=1 Tax=Neobacillus driksii TaxID=3035913 RepID=A0ABV4YUR5_9BACI|nr:YhcN/YlaJ family sporulation lipoprotein [Neobacillus sp. 179.-C4.2 HS]MDP5192931.1 YhcN/YlaJ family sporulation lipoprotein [Neobacillus sp. 179.-C4.2 HS]